VAAGRDNAQIPEDGQGRRRPVTPFHHLRHCCASWLLAAGIDVVAVSERLGHWSPSLTLTTYAHAIREKQAGLARAIGAALG
jgi:integrase